MAIERSEIEQDCMKIVGKWKEEAEVQKKKLQELENKFGINPDTDEDGLHFEYKGEDYECDWEGDNFPAFFDDDEDKPEGYDHAHDFAMEYVCVVQATFENMEKFISTLGYIQYDVNEDHTEYRKGKWEIYVSHYTENLEDIGITDLTQPVTWGA